MDNTIFNFFHKFDFVSGFRILALSVMGFVSTHEVVSAHGLVAPHGVVSAHGAVFEHLKKIEKEMSIMICFDTDFIQIHLKRFNLDYFLHNSSNKSEKKIGFCNSSNHLLTYEKFILKAKCKYGDLVSILWLRMHENEQF